MELKFDDGVTINTDGPLRKLHIEDGWYVVGNRFCIPVAGEVEADETIVEMTKKKTVPNSEIGRHLIFVYGSLRKDQWNHFLLASSEFLGLAKTKDRYALYGNCIPFLSRTKSISQVTGEVYSVDSATLSRLDELEGHPDAYRREQAEVVLEDGTKLIAWLYFCDTPLGHLIESGDFLEKTSTRRGKRRV